MSVNRIFSFGKIPVLALAVWLTASGTVSAAQDSRTPDEYQVKAAILFNFAKFVEWPDAAFPDSAAPILIGVLGEDPFGSALDAAKNRTVNGRKIQIKRFTTVQEVTACHILFISSSEKGRLAPLLRDLRDFPMLLVGDMEKFAQRGGMINLILQNDTIDFEINVDAVKRAGLKINSRLLNMARIVHGMPSDRDK
jgi:hypothetical protein